MVANGPTVKSLAMELSWSALAGGGAAVAAIAAIWAVVVAHRANGQAKRSNKIAWESLKLSQRLAPPPWSQARQVSEDHVVFDNTSGHHIVITSVTIVPDEYGELMQCAPRPHRVEYGDAFAVAWSRRHGLPDPQLLTISWKYEGEDEIHMNERYL